MYLSASAASAAADALFFLCGVIFRLLVILLPLSQPRTRFVCLDIGTAYADYDLDQLCFVANCGLKLDSVEFNLVMRAILIKLIELWQKPFNHSIDTTSIHEISSFFKIQLLEEDGNNGVMNLLFNDMDFSAFRDNVCDFYIDIFSSITLRFFDAYQDRQTRTKCISCIREIEKQIDSINDSNTKVKLSKGLFLSTNCFRVDGNGFPAAYSYSDKEFLNEIWSKYGQYHLDGLLCVVYNMHINELLPNVLVSLTTCFSKAGHDSIERVLADDDLLAIINEIITAAYINFKNEIKRDDQLTDAYETVLEVLEKEGSSEAAVLLDEFRIR